MRAAARSLALAVLAAALGAASLPAQVPQDSVLARLRRAEEALEQLRAELGQRTSRLRFLSPFVSALGSPTWMG